MYRILTCTCTLIIGTAAMALAQGNTDRLTEELGLTDSQKQAIEDVRYTAKAQAIQLKADLSLAKLDLQRLKADPNASLQQVEAQIDEVSRIRAELEKNSYRQRSATRDLLTETQLELWDRHMLERKAERRGRRASTLRLRQQRQRSYGRYYQPHPQWRPLPPRYPAVPYGWH